MIHKKAIPRIFKMLGIAFFNCFGMIFKISENYVRVLLLISVI